MPRTARVRPFAGSAAESVDMDYLFRCGGSDHDSRSLRSQPYPASVSEASTITVPWHIRLKAWWEGYDPDEYVEWRDRDPESGADGEDTDDPSMPASIALPKMMSFDDLMASHATESGLNDGDLEFLEEVAPDPVWPRAKVEVSQRVFGRGFVTPGGAEQIIDAAKSLGLDPVQSVLDLTMRLGGEDAAIAGKYGVWVTGYERNPALFEISGLVLPTIPAGDQVRPSFYDPETVELPRKKFDVVLSNENMHCVQDRVALIAKIYESLKDWGQFLMSDFVLPDEKPPSERLMKWLQNRGEPVTLWTKEQYEVALANQTFDVRFVKEESEDYEHRIRHDFAAFVETLNADKVVTETPVARAALVDLAEDWSRLASLLQKGELQLVRILAMKRGES